MDTANREADVIEAAAAVGRVLTHIGEQYVPAQVNRQELARDLVIAFAAYRSIASLHSAAARKSRKAKARAVSRHADALLKLLGEDQSELVMQLRYFFPLDDNDEVNSDARIKASSAPETFGASLHAERPANTPNISGLRLGLSELKKVTDAALVAPSPGDDLAATALKTMIGTHLPYIYKKHLDREAGWSRHWDYGGAPYGPYVRFVQAIADELDIKVSAETIGSYLRGKSG